MSRRSLGGALKISSLAVIFLTVVLCLAVVLCSTLGCFLLRFLTTPPSASGTPSAPTPALTESEALLASTQIPPLDPYDLARRLKHVAGALPPSTAMAPVEYSLGDHETFWLLNPNPVETFQIGATLRHISPHLYMWVQDDLDVQQGALERSAQTFEERLYPTVRRYFGAEWSPGIDYDERLTVLNARFSGAVGYFSTGDEYPTTVMPYSNQREMFYINPEYGPPGGTSYDGTLAHEFQHMVHWNADNNEDAWVTEGASELAMHLCGYSRDGRIRVFANNPDTQLTSWASAPDSVAQHYGAAFLFLTYFAERFGPPMTRDLVANELDGIAGFESVLHAHETNLDFADLFADWVVANYLDGESSVTADAQYRYEGLDVQVKAERFISNYPAKGGGTVNQYATDYIELELAGHDLRVDFAGVASTRLVPNQAHSGRYQWWSNRGDNSDMTLTRSFDLSGLKEATLDVWLWYDIEDGWDYAYVEASTDGGATWHILPGQDTTTENPSGNSYGSGYTGVSGAGHATSGSPEWTQETFDLSPFAGQQVLVRFEYLTDEVLSRPGLCVDDIRIAELGYSYDVEEGDDGWLAQGFVRSDNTLPQRYIVQLIRLPEKGARSSERGEVTVERLPLSEEQSGTLILRRFDQSMGKAVLVISGATPGSDEAASYQYQISPLK
jgi:immune inhibitor A